MRPEAIRRPAAAAHHEDARRGDIVPARAQALEHVVEELQPQVRDALGEVAAGRRGGAEVGIARPGAVERCVAVRPGTHQEVLRRRLGGAEGGEGLGGGARVGVVPAAAVDRRHVGGLVDEALEVHARELPERVLLGRLGEQVDGPAFVVPGQREGCVAGPPGQAGEPGAQVDGGAVEGLVEDRVGLGFGRDGGVPECPGEPAQLERAALPQRGAEPVERALIDPHRREVGRVLGGRGGLHPGEVGGADHADLAVAPGLLGKPFDGVVAVFSFVLEQVEVAFGGEAAAHILNHAGVAAAGPPFAVEDDRLGALVIRRAGQDRGEGDVDRYAVTGGQVDIGREADAVAHGHGAVALDDDVVFGLRVLGHGWLLTATRVGAAAEGRARG